MEGCAGRISQGGLSEELSEKLRLKAFFLTPLLKDNQSIQKISVTKCVGTSSHQQASNQFCSRHQLGVLQPISILTLPTWGHYQIPEAEAQTQMTAST